MGKLLDDIHSGHRQISSLSGTEYQDLVFERLLEVLSCEPSIEKVENHPRGAVDYVVYERASSLSEQPIHYFECKNYGRALELDNVAKVMVVAVAEHPNSVNVVSRTPLQPQVREYVAQLFKIVDEQSSDCRSPIFKAITFRHWQTDKLVNFHLPALSHKDEPDSLACEKNDSIAWWLMQCGPFSDTLIASSGNSNYQLYLPHGCRCLLSMDVPWEMESVPAIVGLPEGCWSVQAGDRQAMAERRNSFNILIDTAYLVSGQTYSYWVNVGRKGIDAAYRLPPIQTMGKENVDIPELRGDQVSQFVQQLGPAGDGRLVLVDGEAGVGKTHFIERTALELRTRFGFYITCFTISCESGETLLRDLLLNCLTPCFEGMSFKTVADAVSQRLSVEDPQGFSPEAYLGHLVRLVVRIGDRVLVLRDCQHLNESLANQLWALIQALDDAGWGGFRLVLESRQPEASENPALSSLVSKIRHRVRKALVEKVLKPLGTTEMSKLTLHLFESITPELNRCLFHKTGGLPLFIDSYLNRLIALCCIKRKERGGSLFVITEPARILADSIPADGAILLEDRICTWLNTHFGTAASNVGIALGLLAIADDAPRQAIIRGVLGLTEAWQQTMRRAIDAGGLGYTREDGEIVFRHDLLRVATISIATSLPRFVDTALDVTNKIPAEGIQALAIRADLFSVAGDRLATELELRRGAETALNACDFSWQVTFLSRLVAMLSERSDAAFDSLLPMSGLAWAEWSSGSILAARERYRELAALSQQLSDQHFSIAETTATDAYRRIAGINLDLMEPLSFLDAVKTVLSRQPDSISFNSILNRLVLYCARFGHPDIGYEFAQLGFQLIGDGHVENQGAVLCSDFGMLYMLADPAVALQLFQQGVALAGDERQRTHNQLDILVTKCIGYGNDLNADEFTQIWTASKQNRFSGISVRAALLQGALSLRRGDIGEARRWLNSAQAGVSLYHMKFLDVYLRSNLLILALMENDNDRAHSCLHTLADEFTILAAQREAAASLLPEFLSPCHKVSSSLPQDDSPIIRPHVPPKWCNPLADLWWNISGAAILLDMGELADKFKQAPTWIPERQLLGERNPRHVQVQGQVFALGAH
jgi:hypothetical protein